MVRRVALLAALLALAAPAGADATTSFPYSPFGGTPQLVPGGAAILELRGRSVQLARFDEATGARTVLASRALDPRVKLGYDDAGAIGRSAPGRVALSLAQSWIDPSLAVNPIGGDVLAGPAGGPLKSLHHCAGETSPAPLDLDGDVLVSAERTACKRDGAGQGARFDVVARDLRAGTPASRLAHGVVVGRDEVRVAYPYAAVAVGSGAFGDGYAASPNHLRVYDLRTGKRVTNVGVPTAYGAGSIGVTASGRVVACADRSAGDSRVAWAARGEKQLHVTRLPCVSVAALPDGRVAASGFRSLDIDDPVTGARTTVLYTEVGPFRFDADGARVAWTGAGCRQALLHVAPIAELPPAHPAAALTCKPAVGPEVTLAGRRAQVAIRCPSGCAGELQLYVREDAYPLARVAVDPEPGKETVETLEASREAARRLRKHDRVQVVLFSRFDGHYHGVDRPLRVAGS